MIDPAEEIFVIFQIFAAPAGGGRRPEKPIRPDVKQILPMPQGKLRCSSIRGPSLNGKSLTRKRVHDNLTTVNERSIGSIRLWDF